MNMNRTHTICCCLIASAVVLSGMLITQLGQRYENPADAAMVIARDNFSLMTAKTRSSEEALFILDNASGTLLVYNMEIARRRIALADGVKLDQLFGNVGRGDGDADERRPRR